MNKLRFWRIKRGMTLEQLAEASKINRDTISRIENGRLARPLTVGKLANALDLSPDDLTELIASPEIPNSKGLLLAAAS